MLKNGIFSHYLLRRRRGGVTVSKKFSSVSDVTIDEKKLLMCKKAYPRYALLYRKNFFVSKKKFNFLAWLSKKRSVLRGGPLRRCFERKLKDSPALKTKLDILFSKEKRKVALKRRVFNEQAAQYYKTEAIPYNRIS